MNTKVDFYMQTVEIYNNLLLLVFKTQISVNLRSTNFPVVNHF